MTDGLQPTLDARVRALYRTSVVDLRRAIIRARPPQVARLAGRGPRGWSKNELINYCLTECVHVPGVPDGE